MKQPYKNSDCQPLYEEPWCFVRIRFPYASLICQGLLGFCQNNWEVDAYC